MKKMRWLGVCMCLTLLAAGCTGTGENQYNPPLLNKDASALLELRSNIDFGARLTEERFSTEKVLTGYVFDANKGARVTVTLKSTNGETPVLILYGPVNNQGIWGEHIALDIQGQGNLDGLISGLSLPASGRYLVALGTVDGSVGGTFDLTLGCNGVCSEPHCPDVACDLYCPNGFMTDPDGCPVCICAEQECQTDEDCMDYPWMVAEAARCVDGRCVFEELYCDEATPCPEGFECVFGPCPDAPCTPDYCPPCPGRCEPVTVNECNDDSECPDGFVCMLQCTGMACEPGSSDCPPDCDPATGECPVECFGQCVPQATGCQTNDECPPGYVCEVSCWDCDPTNPDGSDCLPGCEGHCVPETLPECDSDMDCPEGFECVMECWAAGCDESGACPPECDPATGECDPICVGRCVPRQDECQVDEDCWLAGGDIGRCIDGRCVFDEIPCGDDGTLCPPGMECVTVCWDCPDGDPDCLPGCESYCVPVNNECYADTDCISPEGTLGHCVEGRCVFEPLYCHANWECPPGFVCEMMGCDPGCDDATNPDCCVGICVPDQQPECWSDEDCRSADGDFGRCIDGRCVFDPCACPEIWDPVCAIVCYGDPDDCLPGEPCGGACEERTFPNACFAECEGAQIIHMGECGTNPGVCFTDADCLPGEYCEHCIGPDGTMGPCYEEGVCLPIPQMECTTDEECPDGFRCEVGYCPDMPCDPDGSCPPCWGQCVPIASQCIVTGCSGEICAPYPMSSTCVWLPEYECLRLSTCELLTSGSGMQTCGWVQTPEYLQCLENINSNNQCDGDDQCPPGMVCEIFCDAAGVCHSQCVGQDCICPEYYEPVCGYDGVTYDNICFLECAGVEMMFPGPCEDHP